MRFKRWFALSIIWSIALVLAVAAPGGVGAQTPADLCPESATGSPTDTAAASTADAECVPGQLERSVVDDGFGSNVVDTVATGVAAVGLIVIGALVFRFAHRKKLTG